MNHTKKGVLGREYQEKWENTQSIIEEVRDMLEEFTKIHRPRLD